MICQRFTAEGRSQTETMHWVGSMLPVKVKIMDEKPWHIVGFHDT